MTERCTLAMRRSSTSVLFRRNCSEIYERQHFLDLMIEFSSSAGGKLRPREKTILCSFFFFSRFRNFTIFEQNKRQKISLEKNYSHPSNRRISSLRIARLSAREQIIEHFPKLSCTLEYTAENKIGCILLETLRK